MSKLQYHPYAELFPLMTEDEMYSLAADLKEYGLREPILLYEGKILDGRNRHAACLRAGIKPQFKDFEGDDAAALAYVESVNLQRRNLTPGQLAIVAARALSLKTNGHGGNRRSSGRSGHLNREQIAKQYKVGYHSVQQAKTLLEEAPDLADEVFTGRLRVSVAFEELQKRREDNARRERELQLLNKYDALRQAVDAGDMSLDEAKEKAMQEERDERERLHNEKTARRIWWSGLHAAIHWFKEYVARSTDLDLTFSTGEDTCEGEAPVTRECLDLVIQQTRRLKKFIKKE
jgi:hypothetical protein